MKERESFDTTFREVTRNKVGITEKIRNASRDPDVRYISSGVLLACLGAGGIPYLGWSFSPFFIPAAPPIFFAGALLLSLPGFKKLSDDTIGVAANNRDEAYKIATEALTVYKVKQKDSPSREQIETLLKKIFYLPPVGGKITLKKKSLWPTALSPALTTDEKVEEIIRFRKNGELDSAYVHQLTIQGRMPDEFKYAALALIINSTYRSDWSKPFYEAYWGKIAPLIHDGGNVNTDINPFWSIKGRTDFLQRVATVYEPELENMEQYATPQLATQFASDDLANAVSEQEERRRLILEVSFYQRAAFALHAKIGRLPDMVPPDVSRKARETWRDFVKSMKNILNAYNRGDIAKPRWFTRIPRKLHGRGELRYEANYKSVQQALMSLEEIKSKNPSLRQEVNALMSKTVSCIDNAIGI